MNTSFFSKITLTIALAAAAFLMSPSANAASAEQSVASENALMLKERLAQIRAANKQAMKDTCAKDPSIQVCKDAETKKVARLQKAIAKEEALMQGLTGKTTH